MAKYDNNNPQYADLQKGTRNFWKPAVTSGYTGLAALLAGGFPCICGGFMFMWGFMDFLMMVETQGLSADKKTCENREYLSHCFCPMCILVVNSVSVGVHILQHDCCCAAPSVIGQTSRCLPFQFWS